MHVREVAHETLEINPLPGGRTMLAQVVPPSRLIAANPMAELCLNPRGFGPIAIQDVAVSQVTSSKFPPPLGIGVADHAPPPSLLMAMPLPPTATHLVAVGQVTEDRPRRFGGTSADFQVPPSSLEITTRPTVGPPASGAPPTATQTPSCEHVTLSKVVETIEMRREVQEAPPLRLDSVAFEPTATQCLWSPQEMALRLGVRTDKETVLSLEPPS
jgi:hypothetical protein